MYFVCIHINSSKTMSLLLIGLTDTTKKSFSSEPFVKTPSDSFEDYLRKLSDAFSRQTRLYFFY